MFLVGNFQACKHTLTRKWYFKQCICLFFLCRWNSIGFIKINLGGPNRQVVHWLQETTVFLRPLHYHPLEQNPGELGYTEDSTTQLNMDEKNKQDFMKCHVCGFWALNHCSLGTAQLGAGTSLGVTFLSQKRHWTCWPLTSPTRIMCPSNSCFTQMRLILTRWSRTALLKMLKSVSNPQNISNRASWNQKVS